MDFFNKNFLYCSHCYKEINEIENFLFVEDSSLKGFCSEDCILGFYGPLINYFQKYHRDLLKELNLEDRGREIESMIGKRKLSELFSKTLNFPTHVYKFESDASQNFFFHHRDFSYNDETYTFILVCLYFEEEPSFVLERFITQNEKIKIAYRTKFEKVLNKKQEKDIDEELGLDIELFKSQILAELLPLMNEDDIPFEEFHLFESYITPTIQEPDEIYLYKEDEQVFSYIKSFKEEKGSFFFIVLCLKNETKESTEFISVLSFPARNPEVYKKYSRGKAIKSNIKN